MRRLFCLVAAVLLLLTAASCASPAKVPADPAKPADQPEASQPENNDSGVGLANPMVQVEDPQEIEDKLGIFIEAPESAANVDYFIVADKVAQCQFVYEEDNYSISIAKGTDDISGVYDVLEVSKDMSFEGYEYKIRYNPDGIGVSDWYDELTECTYSIFMPEGASEEKLKFMTEFAAPAS